MKTLMILALMFLSLFTTAGEGKLAPLALGDLAATEVVGEPVRAKRPDSHRAGPVAMSWAIAPDNPLDLAPQPYTAESKGYFLRLQGTDLLDGVALPVTHPGALIRMTSAGPAGKRSTPIRGSDLVFVNQSGEAFSGGRGIRPVLDTDQVPQRKTAFAPGTNVFQLHEVMGTGEFFIFSDDQTLADRQLTIEVLELRSPVSLRLQTRRDAYFMGQEVTVDAALLDAGLPMNASYQGQLMGPDGTTLPLTFENGTGSATLPTTRGDFRGLWKVRVTAMSENGEQVVLREAHTAFAMARPTARLTGDLITNQDHHGITATLNVDVAAAGRYELRGILFGTDSGGQQVPLAIAHAADWLSPGATSLALNFEAGLLAHEEAGAPYTVKDLRLIHQNRMSLLHRQQTGFHIQ